MKRKLNEEWTGIVVGKMHQFGISESELATRCGYSAQYISMLLNGKKNFRTEKSKLKTINHVMGTLDEIIEEVRYEHYSQRDFS